MARNKSAAKGAVLEEVLRAYFLRAGFFVMRGVPFRFAEHALTDVDLWIYEKPTGTSRRVQICDIKYRQRPKAVERMFWTRGLADALEVDGAYVATTDKRRNLRPLAEKLNLQLIDGIDIRRIQDSQSILYSERISDEQLVQELRSVDKQFRNKNLQRARIEVLSALSEGFGAPSIVRALEGFVRLAGATVEYHPNSQAARAAGRLAYLAAAVACESLDYVSLGAAFRAIEEKRELLLNSVRFGALSNEGGHQRLKLAIALMEKYAPGGKATAAAMETALKKDFNEIPAEIVADQATRLLKCDQLFLAGRELEMASYQVDLPPFDALEILAKGMLGAFLDYAGIDRIRFAQAWSASPEIIATNDRTHAVKEEARPQQALFHED